MRAEQTARSLTTLNGHLRSSMDLVVRDFLQVGQGLRSAASSASERPGLDAIVRPGPAAAGGCAGVTNFPGGPDDHRRHRRTGPRSADQRPVHRRHHHARRRRRVDDVNVTAIAANGQSMTTPASTSPTCRTRSRQHPRRRPARSAQARHVRASRRLRHGGGRPGLDLRARGPAAGSTSSTRPVSWWHHQQVLVAGDRDRARRHRCRHPGGTVGRVAGPDDHLLRGYDHQPGQPAADAPDQCATPPTRWPSSWRRFRLTYDLADGVVNPSAVRDECGRPGPAAPAPRRHARRTRFARPTSPWRFVPTAQQAERLSTRTRCTHRSPCAVSRSWIGTIDRAARAGHEDSETAHWMFT